MKEREESNGYSLVIGGTGLDHFTASLARRGFRILPSFYPEKILENVGTIKPHGLILSDTMMSDPVRRLMTGGEERLMILLEHLQRLGLDKNVRAWLIISRPPEIAWKDYSRFGLVHEIKRVVNPVLFAGDLLAYLQVNHPLTKKSREAACR